MQQSVTSKPYFAACNMSKAVNPNITIEYKQDPSENKPPETITYLRSPESVYPPPTECRTATGNSYLVVVHPLHLWFRYPGNHATQANVVVFTHVNIGQGCCELGRDVGFFCCANMAVLVGKCERLKKTKLNARVVTRTPSVSGRGCEMTRSDVVMVINNALFIQAVWY